ncbi:MAG: hypothetical protein IJM85_03845, partial [Clostridia bacterium]|nr:hypothetical protein [Clostridia bacterium]
LAETRSEGARPPLKLRKALVTAAAVVLVFAVSASIAQAAGFRVWSALIHWDAGMLHIKSTDKGEGLPPEGSDPAGSQGPIKEIESVQLTFEDYGELLGYLDGRVPLPPETEELRFKSAIVNSVEGTVTIGVNYQLCGKGAYIDAVWSKVRNDDYFSFETVIQTDPENVTVKTIKGYECTFVAKNGRTLCFFGSDGLFYSIDFPEGMEKTEAAVNAILDQLAG